MVNSSGPTRRDWLKRSAFGFLGLHLPSSLLRAASNEFKISRAEVFGLRIPFHERVRENMLENYRRENTDRPAYFPWIVKLQTAGGLVGLGESFLDPRPHVARLKDRSVWDFFNDETVGPAIMMAIYDLAAQIAGVPLSKIFSPAPRKLVQQTWWSHCLRPALMQAEAKRGLGLGYMVHKVKARQYEEPAEQIAAIAEVAPHDYQIYMDANGSFGSPGRTVAVAESLKRFHIVKGFEQPIAHEDLAGYRAIRKSLTLRLAVHYEAVDTRTFMNESICDAFVVEDWKWGPGLASKSERCKINGQSLWVENGLFSGISQVFQAHQCAALPNVEFIISLTHVAEDDIVVEPFTVEKGGFYKIPEKPGLGVTLDQQALEKYRIV
jgi:L-alanine-DL-glutamate epimerase-like enolase superfamily enzyme